MKKMIMFLAVFSVAFISCKKDKDEDPAPTPTPTPVVKDFDYVKAGAKWTYVTSDTDPNHQGITYEQSYLVKTKDADGWCTVDWTLYAQTYPLEWFADATMFSDMASKGAQSKFPLIKANPVLNDSYSITYNTSTGVVTNTREVKSLTESITVPLGSYTNCVKIHETTSADSLYYKDYWIDKTIGVVRMEGTTKEDFPVIIIEELKTKL